METVIIDCDWCNKPMESNKNAIMLTVCKSCTDENNRQMDEAMRLWSIEEKEIIAYRIERNIEILKVIKKKYGAALSKDIRDYDYDNEELYHPYRIAKKPIGKKQAESGYRVLREVWIEQYCGYSGDDYSGNVSVKLEENKYLIMPFRL